MAETTLNAHDGRQRAAEVQRGTARAAVLGVSDGLVTNVSLILGVAAAELSPAVVRLAGLASLVAGACSMAVGEYVSMRAQVELLEGLLMEEARRLRGQPGSRARRPGAGRRPRRRVAAHGAAGFAGVVAQSRARPGHLCTLDGPQSGRAGLA
ncbi:MAG TPA: VIT1/CCC1 transporter family protein, partial [Myxococcales bacterium]